MHSGLHLRLLTVGLCAAAFLWPAGAGADGGSDSKKSATQKFAVLAVQNGQGKISYEVIPVAEAKERGKELIEAGKDAVEEWNKRSSKEKREQQKPQLVKVKLARTDISKEKDAKKLAEQLFKKLPKSRRAETGEAADEPVKELDLGD